MQRALVMLVVFLLVLVSLGIGVVSAHWPFWHRAWQWQVAANGWPTELPGATRVLQGGDAALPLKVREDASLAAVAATASTQALLVAGANGEVQAWFAPGMDAASAVDGRGLTALLLTPLFAQLVNERAGLLDQPVGALLPEWRADTRGAITARQLFWQLSGMPAKRLVPLNPFNARAQLAAGPDFSRTALGWKTNWPAGSHFEESPVNAQLLAMVVAAAQGAPFVDGVQRLWSQFAADEAKVMLDHRGGEAAAHCCLRASLADWARLGLLIAGNGRGRDGLLWQPGFLDQAATPSPVHEGYGLGFGVRSLSGGHKLLTASSPGRQLLLAPHAGIAVLWVGEGAAPAGLDSLLPTHSAGVGL
jgi:CubicO group peptidase (beta-lactamase class C family)